MVGPELLQIDGHTTNTAMSQRIYRVEMEDTDVHG